MKPFEELYCEKKRCDAVHFKRNVFWQTLPLHARLVAPYLGGFDAHYFATDRDLLAGVARAVTVGRVREEIRDYFDDPQNRGWLRRATGIRIS